MSSSIEQIKQEINAKIRPMIESDYCTLEEFLYHAAYVPKGGEAYERDIIYEPNNYVYIKDFGTQTGDLGVVAEVDGKVVGAAWGRILPVYGFVDPTLPFVVGSMLPPFRGLGIGRKMLDEYFQVLKVNGYTQISGRMKWLRMFKATEFPEIKAWYEL